MNGGEEGELPIELVLELCGSVSQIFLVEKRRSLIFTLTLVENLNGMLFGFVFLIAIKNFGSI